MFLLCFPERGSEGRKFPALTSAFAEDRYGLASSEVLTSLEPLSLSAYIILRAFVDCKHFYKLGVCIT
jgi:hypothetical protein